MIRLLIEKELKASLASPRFVATFAVCSVLLLLSVYIGLREYASSLKQYDSALALNSDELRQTSDWMGLRSRAYRRPEPMQVFVSGVHYDVGRYSSIEQSEPARLRNSPYSDDPIFAFFRTMDFT